MFVLKNLSSGNSQISRICKSFQRSKQSFHFLILLHIVDSCPFANLLPLQINFLNFLNNQFWLKFLLMKLISRLCVNIREDLYSLINRKVARPLLTNMPNKRRNTLSICLVVNDFNYVKTHLTVPMSIRLEVNLATLIIYLTKDYYLFYNHSIQFNITERA